MGGLRSKLSKWMRKKLEEWGDPLCVSFAVNAAIALILAALGLDRGFIGQFFTRIQNPLVCALLTVSFAATLVSVWFERGELGDIMLALFVPAFFSLMVRAPMAMFERYLPILSPLTLAPLLWLLWPVYVVCVLSAGPWSADFGVKLGLFALMLAMWASPAAVAYAGRRFQGYIQRRRNDKEMRELIFKDARVSGDYVWILTSSPNRGRTIRELNHDFMVAMKYGDVDRANEIRSAGTRA